MKEKKSIKFICKDSKGKDYTKHLFTKEQILEASMEMVKGNVGHRMKCQRCNFEMNLADIKDNIEDGKIKALLNKLIDLGLKV